ncbi:MAG: hypothetical protein IMZ46_10750 [Acidobacteria bacterium]|nr:hypothetical protein [Acidobacteriota bacterium]
MSSLVSDFIINPVLRQARRLSEISRPATDGLARIAGNGAAAVPRTADTPPIGTACDVNTAILDTAMLERTPSTSSESTSVELPVDGGMDERVYPAPSPDSGPSPAPAPRVLPARLLPEDDGRSALRQRLLDIHSREIPADEKARLMHEALMEGHRKSRRHSRPGDLSQAPALPVPAGDAWEQSLAHGPLDGLRFWQHTLSDVSAAETFTLTADDVKPTYAPNDGHLSTKFLGCQHYRRSVKLQCSTCGKWYTCRFCHDAAEDHALVRKDTTNMLCMVCACPQRASDMCVSCGASAARYYCGICKLWDDHPLKNIYHCNDCGICRRGIGLGKDFFHCKVCATIRVRPMSAGLPLYSP